MTTHQLDQPDAVQRAARFGVGRADRPRRRLDRGGETEAAFDPVQVVVDRLGDADHGEVPPPAQGFGRDGVAPRSVPSPPMQNRTDTSSRTRVSTIVAGICGPRDEARIVPPWA